MVNYLYNFEEGVVYGGNTLRFFLKLGLLYVLLSFGVLSFSKTLFIDNAYLILFFILSSLLILLRAPYYISRDLLFLNNIISLPILIASVNNIEWYEKNLFKILIFSVLLWTIIDWALLITNSSLWGNSAFIGGMGNPSTYGLLLIFIYSTYIIRQNGKKKLLLLLLVVPNIFLTQALMPILIFLFIVFLSLSKKLKIFVFVLLGGLVYFLDEALEFLPQYHWKMKLQALLNFFSNYDISETSASIYTRLEFFNEVFLIFENPQTFLFGNINGTYYNSGDSMLVTYLTSFGVPIFTIFLIGIIKVLRDSYKTKYFYFFLACLLMMLTNRIFDYWPVSIIFFLTLNLLKRENEHSHY